MSADELLGEHVRREAREIADTLALADQLDGNARLLLHGEDEAALGRTVELRQHEPGDAGVLDEGLRLRQAVLTRRGVEDEQDLRDRRQLLDDAAHLREL